MSPYFYVYRPGTAGPKVKHDTVAQAEAERLAAKHPGATFEILQVIGLSSTHVPTATTFWLDDADKPEPATDTLDTIDWSGTAYRKIAALGKGWHLIAHPNGPAITNGNALSTIDIHTDEPPALADLKRRAQEAFLQWAWPRLVENMTFLHS